MARPSNSFRLGIPLGFLILGAGCLPNSEEHSSVAIAKPTSDPADVPPALKPAPLAKAEKTVDPLQQRIESALKSVHSRDLLTTNSFWTIFHGILGMGPKTLLKDPETKEHFNAIDYVFNETGAKIRGLQFTPTDAGLDVQTVGMNPFLKEHEGQGHQDQFLAEMIQWGVPADRPVKIAGVPRRRFICRTSSKRAKLAAGSIRLRN